MLLDSDEHHEPTGHHGTTEQVHHDADVHALTLDATLSALCNLAEEPRVLGEVHELLYLLWLCLLLSLL